MQVEIDVKCMQTDFGGCNLFGFGDFTPFHTFQTTKFSLLTMDYSPPTIKEYTCMYYTLLFDLMKSFSPLVPATVTSLVGFTLHRQNGDNATMIFALSEDSPLVKTNNIRWFLKTVSSFEDITFRSDSRQSLSADRLSLLIDGITESDEGEYILRATNEAGTSEGVIVISVAGKI